MPKIIVYELKDSKGEYIKNCGETTTDLSEAFAFWTDDGSSLDVEDVKKHIKEAEITWEKYMKGRFGEKAVINYRPYSWLRFSDLVVIDVDDEMFEKIKGYN